MRFIYFFNGLFVAVVFAQTLRAEPGFYKTNLTDTPAYIREASKAVYRYVILTEEPVAEIPNTDFDKTISQYEKKEFVKRLVAEEVKKCRSALMSSCPIYHAGSGTAFITGAQFDRLITVAHNIKLNKDAFHRFLDTEKGKKLRIFIGKNELIYARNLPLRFCLFDSDGKIVFDTRVNGDHAEPEVLGFGEMLEWHKGFFAETPVDFVSIKLSRSVGTHQLEMRQDRPALEETLSVVGYPGPTHSRKLLDKVPDSDGISQLYSSGKVLDADHVLHFMSGPDYIRNQRVLDEANRSLIFTDSESILGFSGSPVIDSEGRVVGVLAGNWSVSEKSVFIPNNAILLSSEWILSNLRKYTP